MKEAVVSSGPKVTIKDVDIPEPKADQIVIRVVVSGSNPKDWYESCVLNYRNHSLHINVC